MAEENQVGHSKSITFNSQGYYGIHQLPFELAEALHRKGYTVKFESTTGENTYVLHRKGHTDKIEATVGESIYNFDCAFYFDPKAFSYYTLPMKGKSAVIGQSDFVDTLVFSQPWTTDHEMRFEYIRQDVGITTAILTKMKHDNIVVSGAVERWHLEFLTQLFK